MRTPESSPKPPKSSGHGSIGLKDFINSLNLPQEDILNPLRKFLEHNYAKQQDKSEARLVAFDAQGHIDAQASGGKQGEKKRGDDYSITAEEFSQRHEEPHQPCLLLLQNLTPNWIKLLHNSVGWNVPLDFFLAHVENSDWYTLQNIPEQLPILHSVAPTHIRVQYVVTREWERLDAEKKGRNYRDGQSQQRSAISKLFRRVPPLDSKIQPRRGPAPPHDIAERDTATVPRLASGFDPTPTPPRNQDDISSPDPLEVESKKLCPFACVRNTITIWFDNFHSSPGWTRGVILMYPPFEAADNDLQNLKPSIYRSFIPRDIPVGLDRNEFDSRKSHMDSFLFCLRLNDLLSKERKPKGTQPTEKDLHVTSQPSSAPSPPSAMSLVGDLWRIVASEWLVFDLYAERSLNNIEKWFELYGEDLPQFDLHRLLSQLMKIQRRVTKYCTLVSEQIEACPIHWKDHSDSFHPSPMQDFERIEKLFKHKQKRIGQAIQVAMSLLSTHETKLAESRNAILFILTIVTSILLPFSTVAAIMSIPRDSGLGPSRSGFWKFWVWACVLLALFAICWVAWMLYQKWKLSNSKRRQPGLMDGARRRNKAFRDDVEGGGR